MKDDDEDSNKDTGVMTTEAKLHKLIEEKAEEIAQKKYLEKIAGHEVRDKTTPNKGTEWKKVTYGKNKRSSPEQNQRRVKQKTIPEYSRLINPTNKFQALSEISFPLPDTKELPNEEPKKEVKNNSQPIFISQVKEITPLIKILDNAAKGGYTIKTLAREEIKIMPTSIESYKTIIEKLKENNVGFHTHQLKTNKNFRFVVKNVHHTADAAELKKEIEQLGHTVKNIYNPSSRLTKNPLPMFFVDIAPAENNKDVYEIKHLLNMRITTEAPRPNRQIPQCANCQRYGHTKHYCHRATRCVRCGGGHKNTECKKSKEEKAKCALCEEEHPANYKGCTVYKQIQANRFPALRNRTTTNTQQIENNTHGKIKSKFFQEKSFANATKANTFEETGLDANKDGSKSTNERISKLEQIIEELREDNKALRSLINKLLEKL